MKILKRNYEHRNLILFLLFSMAYLQAIYSLSRGESVLEVRALQSFFKHHYLILALTFVTIYMVVNLKKHSDKILLLCLAVITGKNFIMLASSFNKLILGLNFVYLVFAFYFFVTWEIEIAKAACNPLFAANDLEKEKRFHLKGKVENIDSGTSLDVLVTNIDEDSCFVFLSAPDAKSIIASLDTSRKYKLTADYEGVQFTHEAQVVSTYDHGIGLEFIRNRSKDNLLNWSDLHQVCLERGLFE